MSQGLSMPQAAPQASPPPQAGLPPLEPSIPAPLASYTDAGGGSLGRGVMWARGAKKVTASGKTRERVLILGHKGLVVCTAGKKKKLVSRFMQPSEVRAVVLAKHKGVAQLLIKATHPEPDLLFLMDNLPALNGAATSWEDCVKAVEVLRRSNPQTQIKIVPPNEEADLSTSGRFDKGSDFQKPATKMKMLVENEKMKTLARQSLGPQHQQPLPPPPPPPPAIGLTAPPPPASPLPVPQAAPVAPPAPAEPAPADMPGTNHRVKLSHAREPLGLEYGEHETGVVLIERAQAGSASARHGVPAGRLLAVNGEKVAGEGDFSAIVAAAKAAAGPDEEIDLVLRIAPVDPSIIDVAQERRRIHNKLAAVKHQEEQLELWQWNLENRERAVAELETLDKHLALTGDEKDDAASSSQGVTPEASRLGASGAIEELFDTLPPLSPERERDAALREAAATPPGFTRVGHHGRSNGLDQVGHTHVSHPSAVYSQQPSLYPPAPLSRQSSQSPSSVHSVPIPVGKRPDQPADILVHVYL
eukprot:Rhum_TRINITY_DN18702_c0_g1::Rhum_TRINITY_DN18702_c0_g1_i1::g.168175::m.168175